MLTSGPITIGVSLTINTSTAATQTVSGGGNSGVFVINSGVQATLNNLIIRDGKTSSRGVGGGITNNGDMLAISGSELISNTAAGSGGGLLNLVGHVAFDAAFPAPRSQLFGR